MSTPEPCEHDTLGCGDRTPHDEHTKLGDGRPCCGWPPRCRVDALARVLADHEACAANDSRSREWIDGSGVTGIDVWSCGIEVPYVDNMDTMARLHLAAALAPLLDDAHREGGEKALSDAADAWTQGGWVIAAGRRGKVGVAQALGDWLRARARVSRESR